MASAAGTTLVADGGVDDGADIVDEITGEDVVSDGESDCDCCDLCETCPSDWESLPDTVRIASVVTSSGFTDSHVLTKGSNSYFLSLETYTIFMACGELFGDGTVSWYVLYREAEDIGLEGLVRTYGYFGAADPFYCLPPAGDFPHVVSVDGYDKITILEYGEELI